MFIENNVSGVIDLDTITDIEERLELELGSDTGGDITSSSTHEDPNI